MKNRIGEQPISWTSLTWRNSLLFSTWISVDFAHALNIHASIKTELFMLVRMRYCPRINAPDTRWASANVTSNPYPLICREKKFFVSKKKKKRRKKKNSNDLETIEMEARPIEFLPWPDLTRLPPRGVIPVETQPSRSSGVERLRVHL